VNVSVYAALTEGAVEADIAAIREAMNRTDGITRNRGSCRSQPSLNRFTESALARIVPI
jgi:hypothetical protein